MPKLDITPTLVIGTRVETPYGSHKATEYGTVVKLPTFWSEEEVNDQWYEVELDGGTDRSGNTYPSYRLSLNLDVRCYPIVDDNGSYVVVDV